MMQKCWDVNPSKRPTIGELRDFSKNKLKETINSSNSSSDGKKRTGLIEDYSN